MSIVIVILRLSDWLERYPEAGFVLKLKVFQARAFSSCIYTCIYNCRLLEVLGMYKPFVKEYSRLNITHNVMSKRKLNRLVTERYVRGWDDPRLMTLAGLDRRGVPPVAMNNFCR